MKRLTAVVYSLVLATLVSVFLTGPVPVFSATTGVQIEFLLSQVRNATGSLAGGKVHFYSAGTTTNKAVYLDINKVYQAANPYTLDANGTALLYGDGTYRVVIKTAAGVTVYDRDNLKFEDLATDFINSEYTLTIKPKNITGNSSGTIQGYDIGAPGYTDNVHANYLDVNHARFKNSPWIDVTHPTYGAKGNGITDDHAAIQAAIDVAEANPGSKVIFPVGQYNLGTVGININGNGVVLEGGPPRFVGTTTFGVEFLYSGNGSAVTFGATDTVNYRNEFNSIQVRATDGAIPSASTIGIKIINQHYFSSKNASIKDFNLGIGLYIQPSGTNMFGASSQYHGLNIHVCKYGVKSEKGTTYGDNHSIFIGGAIIGDVNNGDTPGTVGVYLGDGVDGYRFYGTDVESFQIGYQIAGTSHAFFGSRSEFNVKAVQIDNTAANTQFFGHQWANSTRDVTNNGANTIIVDHYGYTGNLLVFPTTNRSDVFVVSTDNLTTIFDISTDNSIVPRRVEILDNTDLIIWSGNFTGQKFKVTGSTGLTEIGGKLKVTGLDNTNGSGSGYLYYDPADSNRVKYVP